jgi:Tol biopolymer transport system component
VDVDLEEGRLLSEPIREPGLTGWDGANAAWSPDGRYLAYLAGDGSSVVVRSSGGNHRQEYRLPGSNLRNPNQLRWAADSRGIRIVPENSFMLSLDLQSGEFSEELLNPVSGPISRDGRTVYKWNRAFDLASGQERDLFDMSRRPTDGVCGGPASNALSPSDDRLALLTSGQQGPGGAAPACIGVVATEGGEMDWILEGPPGSLHRRGFAWSEDGSSLLFQRVAVGDEDPAISGLWVIPAEGGTPKQLMSITSLVHVSVHPDGRRLAYQAGEENYELWVMEGIEEALKR